MRRRWIAAGAGCALAATVGLAGCSRQETDYAGPDTPGAGAPAMRIDTARTQRVPDSTAGLGDRTGRPGKAGDTLAGRRDTQAPPPPRKNP
jgi:hypothetical protein